MKKLNTICLILSAVLVISCKTNDVLNVKVENKPSKGVYFSDELIDYYSYALKYSELTKDKNIIDLKNEIDSAILKRIKNLDIYPNNTMNFVNPYNDTISVIFSFPKRDCLEDKISDYLWNFSFSMQYVIVNTQKLILVDSMKISHETRIVPPVDCAKKNNYLLHELEHTEELR